MRPVQGTAQLLQGINAICENTSGFKTEDELAARAGDNKRTITRRRSTLRPHFAPKLGAALVQ